MKYRYNKTSRIFLYYNAVPQNTEIKKTKYPKGKIPLAYPRMRHASATLSHPLEGR